MGKSRSAPSRKAPPRTGGKGTERQKGRKIHVDFGSTQQDPPEPPIKPRRRPQEYEARPANPGGVYLPDHEQLIRLIAARGMSDDEIELIYGLGKGTLKKWKSAYPGLARAIDEGRTVADANVLFALYKTAVGYDYEEEQAVGGRDPTVLQVRKFKPGEFAAQKHWLGNRIRRPDGSNEWPRSEQVELGGIRDGVGIKVESRNDLIDAIVSLVVPKSDNERTRKSTEDSGRK